MLVGLYVMRQLLEPGGVLLIESNAVDDDTHSYDNFGQFYAGMWWQPIRVQKLPPRPRNNISHD